MSDALLLSTLHAAALRIQGVVGTTAERLADSLAQRATPALNMSRQDVATLQGELQRRLPIFNLEFSSALRERLHTDTEPRTESRRSLGTTSFEALSLVDDDEVDERVASERLSMEIAHDCEWELRELDGYVSALQPRGQSEARNPLRPENVARALLRAIEAVTAEPAYRKLLGREFGRALAPAMRACYAAISEDLREKGVRAADPTLRAVAAFGGGSSGDSLRDSAGASTAGFQTSTSPSGSPAFGPDSRAGLAAVARTAFAASGTGPMPGGARSASASDAQMMDMLRRLAFLNTPSQPASPFLGTAGMPDTSTGVPGFPGDAGASGGMSGLMAVNMIRQHRDELVRASSGALDHMVIDVVAAMFDHLLSDSKVPPQMARQIGRLQMPVLRAALKDMGFFSSRRHPIRRFVNRIASLAVAYEDLSSGPGRDFLERVRALVQEIVEGDFDQMELYESKLQAIEALIAQQSGRDVGTHAKAAAVLDGKETQLRIQQRYMLALRSQLEPLGLPSYLAEFLSQVWSQVQVQLSRAGASAEQMERMHRTAIDLVLSVQPKGEPQLRKSFLLALPQLMKNLNEGLTLIRWPEAAKKEFFGKLLPAHAGSLKTPPASDFEQRQFKHKLDQIGKVAIPTENDLLPSAPAALPAPEEHSAPLQFTAEEAARIGLVEETAIDWDGVVDIDLDAAPVETGAEAAEAGTAISTEVDVEIEAMQQAEGAPPTHGPQLMQHLQTGVAYRMHLENRWQRVRLSWVSPGRAFFVFTHGKAHEKTVSMTSRMLRRMCETERIRAFEQAELIERATSRARKQLAQLSAATRQGAVAARH